MGLAFASKREDARLRMKRQIAKNLVSNYGVNAASLVLGFLLVPFLIVRLGAEAYGMIVLAESAIGFFEIGTISVRVALARHAAFALASGKNREFEEYLSTGRYIAFVSAAAVLVLGLAFSLNFHHVFRVPGELVGQSRLLFTLLVVSFAITVPNIVYWSALYAKERFDLINGSVLVGSLLRAALLFGIYGLTPQRSIAFYGIAYLAMIWTQNVIVWFWHRRVLPDLKVNLSSFRRDKVKEILSLSGHTTLSRVSILLYDNTANVVINLFWGPAANALYSVSLKIPQVLKRFFGDTTWTLTPTFTGLAARGDDARLKKLFFGYTKLVALVTVPLCLTLAIFSSAIIQAWVGPGFESAGSLMPIHLLPLIVGLPLSVCGCLTNAFARVKVPSRVAFVTALANVGIGVLLGRTLGLGVFGIAIAAMAMNMAYATFFAPFYACRIARIPVREYLYEGFFKTLGLAAATLLLPYAAFRVWNLQPGLSPAWLAVAASLAAAYVSGAYAFVLNGDERSKVREALRRAGSAMGKGADTPGLLAKIK